MGRFVFIDNHRSGFRFTPMMSVLIGVVSALFIVALVVILVLRVQCTQNDDRRKRHKGAGAPDASLERRPSASAPTLSDKGGKHRIVNTHRSFSVPLGQKGRPKWRNACHIQFEIRPQRELKLFLTPVIVILQLAMLYAQMRRLCQIWWNKSGICSQGCLFFLVNYVLRPRDVYCRWQSNIETRV